MCGLGCVGECERVCVGGWVHVCSVGDPGGIKKNLNGYKAEFRSCVKVEVAVLGFPS